MAETMTSIKGLSKWFNDINISVFFQRDIYEIKICKYLDEEETVAKCISIYGFEDWIKRIIDSIKEMMEELKNAGGNVQG